MCECVRGIEIIELGGVSNHEQEHIMVLYYYEITLQTEF